MLFSALCAIRASRLLAFCNACRIESATNDVITNTRQILNPAATNKNNRVLLQVVADTGNVNRAFLTVDESYSCNLSECRVRLFRGSRGNGQADASLLRTLVHDRSHRLLYLFFSALSDKLIDSWHIILLKYL